jgi:hypothetical protein
VRNDIDLKARNSPGFPYTTSFKRFGSRTDLVLRLREFATEQDWHDVVALCDARIASSPKREERSEVVRADAEATVGYVYLLKSGRYYKIGRSNAVGRRERELQIQLPEAAEVVHEIKTDDPVGIENYWHTRFGDRRKNGEWFELGAKDVAAFKRRKFM